MKIPSITSIEQAAAEWDARLRSPRCTEADRETFRAWKAVDPSHREAFERLQQSLDLLRTFGERPQFRALREDALQAYHRRGELRRLGKGLVAASFLLMFGVLVLANIDRLLPNTTKSQRTEVANSELVLTPSRTLLTQENIYQTTHNQRTEIRLEDGSTVTLDESTRLVTRYSADRRNVELVTGQALFRVAKDRARPFVVRSGHRMIVALGTEFEVRSSWKSMTVSLFEGKVSVKSAPGAAPTSEIRLSPNQRLSLFADGRQSISTIDTDKLVGLPERRLYFDGTPLREAIVQMNRFSAIKIELADPKLAEHRISGVFRAGNQAGFVGALENYFPIVATKPDRNVILLLPDTKLEK